MRFFVCLLLIVSSDLKNVFGNVQRRQADSAEEDRVVRSVCTTDVGQSGHCVPLATCQFALTDIETLAKNVCPLVEGSPENGVCCPDASVAPAGDSPVNPPVRISAFVGDAPLDVKENDIGASSAAASSGVREREELEQVLLQRGLVTKPGTTEAAHQQIVFASPEAQALGKHRLLASETSRDLTTRLHLTPSATGFNLPSVNIAQSPIANTCPQEPPCPATKYRSFDGTCNNLANKNWGKSFRAFNRLMPALYADGVSAPRVSMDGTPLPSTRIVSTTVLGDKVVEFPDVSMMFSSFGQFLDHDMTLTPATRGANGTGIVCCDPVVIQENLRHPECFQIDIPADDPFYAQFQQTCMEFVRTLPAPPVTCTLSVREQMNQLTAYIDGSQIYGSTVQQADALRSKDKGKLKVSTGSPGREFPPNLNSANCVGDVNSLKFCFQAGDVRSAETPQLATLQILFLREHNRVADELSQLNPGWNDEIIYHEARRIVGAKLQHIVYNEFLPIVLGNRVTRRFDLQLQKTGFWNQYDSNTDATIINEFATAAYRFGHSNIPSMVQLFSGNQNTESQRLRDHFLVPYEGNLINSYIGGLANQANLVTDNEVTKELTEHLFERGNKGFGLDLPAINMQRGRDHAIGTYTQARKSCGLSAITSFEAMASHMYPDAPRKLAAVYKNVDDVDLWIGGVSELSMPGAAVGPTFACIIAEQFRRTRKGDRIWYERGGTESSFTEAQLEQIKETSMARILCDNSDVMEVQPLAFLKPSNWNARVSCDSTQIPKPTVRPWRNEPVWT